MGFLSNLFEVPELLQYVFLPNLTDAEWEEINALRLAAVFTVGVLFGMLFLALFFLFFPLFFN